MYIKKIPPQLTNTWIFLSFANKLKPGSNQPIHLMGRDLVLWRTQSGAISLLDAYCPHMGAHLGYGKVRGENLECIFHKRCFNTEGSCQGRGKDNKSYPISLMNNMIFAWFGESSPTWEMPDLLTGFPGDPTSKWKIFRSKKFNYNFPTKDLLDNTVDAIHFKTFHNQCNTYKPCEILDVTDHRFVSKVLFYGHPKLQNKFIKIDLELDLETESSGPCTLVVSGKVKLAKQLYFFKFIFLCAPIEKENTDYTLALAVRTAPKEKRTLVRKVFEYLYYHYAFRVQLSEFCKESEQIWELKTFLSHPDLQPQEEALKAYAKWYSQFYEKAKQPSASDINKNMNKHVETV